jgi:hypothetical protein
MRAAATPNTPQYETLPATPTQCTYCGTTTG